MKRYLLFLVVLVSFCFNWNRVEAKSKLSREQKECTGLDHNRFRYYNPQTGSYISKDPIGLAGNNPNSYAYTHDSNTMVDPFGLMAGNYEYFYRSMSIEHYKEFLETGRIPATTETFISPTLKFSESYEGVLVKIQTAEGTTNALKDIGVRSHGSKSAELLPDLPQVKRKWGNNKALFKPEGDQINIGLGKGKALNLFNDSIVGHETIKVVKPKKKKVKITCPV